MKKIEVKNVLCVDLEEWYNANLANLPEGLAPEERVEQNTRKLLQHFHEHQAKATFFVVGEIAEKYPEMIREIHNQGHEIGCHSDQHRLIYELTPEEFRKDTRRAKENLERIIDAPVISYRAPSWSVTKRAFWALKILEEEGFCYDSSVFPFENFLYGVKDAPRFAYAAEKYAETSRLIEIPPSTIRMLGQNFPFSGGFYLRALPGCVVKWCISWLNRQGHAAVVYIHPWEIDPQTPKLKMNMRDSLIQYWGISRNEKKLIGILKKFTFVPLSVYGKNFDNR